MLMTDQSPFSLATVSCQLLLSEPLCWKGCSHQLEAVGCSNRARAGNWITALLFWMPMEPCAPLAACLERDPQRVAPGSGDHLSHPPAKSEVFCRTDRFLIFYLILLLSSWNCSACEWVKHRVFHFSAGSLIRSLRCISALPFMCEFVCSHFLVPALCVCSDHLARLGCPSTCAAFKGKNY